MDRYKFGEFIYKKRKELGLTQEELGRKLNLTNKAISKWETGETLPEVSMLVDIAKILNVTVDELLTQEKPPLHFEKPKKTPIIILCIICALISFSFIVFAISKSKKEIINIDDTNYTEYYNISLSLASLKGTTLNIKVEVYDINVTNPSLEINCKVVYYYKNETKDGEITYTDRFITYDATTHEFYLELAPIIELPNITFVGYDISYELIKVEGKIIK